MSQEEQKIFETMNANQQVWFEMTYSGSPPTNHTYSLYIDQTLEFLYLLVPNAEHFLSSDLHLFEGHLQAVVSFLHKAEHSAFHQSSELQTFERNLAHRTKQYVNKAIAYIRSVAQQGNEPEE